MSERKKLEESWKFRLSKGDYITPAQMIVAMGKLVENCPHNKAHWIQEISREGEFSDKIVKRCYLCGFNIDEMEVESEFVEQLLTSFDRSCEEKKTLKEKLSNERI